MSLKIEHEIGIDNKNKQSFDNKNNYIIFKQKTLIN